MVTREKGAEVDAENVGAQYTYYNLDGWTDLFGYEF